MVATAKCSWFTSLYCKISVAAVGEQLIEPMYLTAEISNEVPTTATAYELS